MTDSTTEQFLVRLRKMVADAKNVPMSASCMINRAEASSLIDQALTALSDELAEAERIRNESSAEVLRGRDEGDRIRIEAEEWATNMASQTEIVQRAQRQAEKLVADAKAESEGLRTETDKYVDQRMAEFEAVLAKTTTQVTMMRSRLAARSGLDDLSEETTVIPRF